MPSANVLYPPPLQRLNPWYPGQFGVPGAWTDTGLREHCTGTVFYVDPNYPGASDARDGTDPTDPLLTVTAALARCQDYRGDVVAVMANQDWPYASGSGGYTTGIVESVTVGVAGVRLVGLFPSSAVGVPWQPGASGEFCITVEAMDVLIEGFAFNAEDWAAGDGIYASWGDPPNGESLTVRHCLFQDTIDCAIQLEYAWYCDIHHNFFQEVDEFGVMTAAPGDGTSYTRIHHNVFHDCTVAAISLLAVAGNDDNFIYDNIIWGDGTGTNNFINLTGGTRNTVCRNVMSCTLGAEYNTTCSDATSGSWIHNYLENGVTTANPT